jgi:hypothetical protein
VQRSFFSGERNLGLKIDDRLGTRSRCSCLALESRGNLQYVSLCSLRKFEGKRVKKVADPLFGDSQANEIDPRGYAAKLGACGENI